MSETARLELIAEAVHYCQHVSALGMPPSAYSKALREPVHFLWERRFGSKLAAAKYRSKAATGLSTGESKLVYDHAVPFVYLQRRLLSLGTVTLDSIRATLEQFNTTVWITKKEDKLLNSAGLNRKMPDSWDGEAPLARYKAVGIPLRPNAHYAAGE